MSDNRDELAERVRTAHGDTWQLQGRLRLAFGGGAIEMPGIRLMASGITAAQWNNGDVTDAAQVDIEAVRAWYASRAAGVGVPWGLRVALGADWRHGRLLFEKRCMALLPHAFTPAPVPPHAVLRAARSSDLEAIVAIDAAAFDDPPELTHQWVRPQLGAPGFTTVVAEVDGAIVGMATALDTNERAGRCAGIFGVAVSDSARRRGLGAAVSSWLIERAFESGVELLHLNPDSDDAARIYARLGFVETVGFNIYIEN